MQYFHRADIFPLDSIGSDTSVLAVKGGVAACLWGVCGATDVLGSKCLRINRQHALWASKGWAHNACEAPAGDLCAHASWALSSPAQSNQPTNNQNVRDKGNPIEKCAGQRKSYRKMCGAKEILLKNVRDKGNPIEKCAGQRKSY